MTQSAQSLVFVYGTLKRGGSNHAFLAGQTFVRSARTVAGYSLVHLNDFPGMILDETDTSGVGGEIWSVDAACLAGLDELEGIEEGLYRREPIHLQTIHTHEIVQAYLYAGDVAGRPRLAGGQWP